MSQIIYGEQSIDDLGEIFDYVARHSAGGAERLALALLKKCRLLGRYP